MAHSSRCKWRWENNSSFCLLGIAIFLLLGYVVFTKHIATVMMAKGGILMASIRKRGSSYLIVVSMGYDYNGNRIKPQQKIVRPPEWLTPKQKSS